MECFADCQVPWRCGIRGRRATRWQRWSQATGRRSATAGRWRLVSAAPLTSVRHCVSPVGDFAAVPTSFWRCRRTICTVYNMRSHHTSHSSKFQDSNPDFLDIYAEFVVIDRSRVCHRTCRQPSGPLCVCALWVPQDVVSVTGHAYNPQDRCVCALWVP